MPTRPSPPGASYVPTVSSPNGEPSIWSAPQSSAQVGSLGLLLALVDSNRIFGQTPESGPQADRPSCAQCGGGPRQRREEARMLNSFLPPSLASADEVKTGSGRGRCQA